MAEPKLCTYVCVTGPDGMVQFGPGDDLPSWASAAITNPAAWETPPDPPAPKPAKEVSTDADAA